MSPRRPAVRVSDHALLRFLERAGGFDVEPLRAVIEESLKRAMSAAATVDAGEYVIVADGLRYLIRDNVVTTIAGGSQRRRKPARK